MWLLALAFLAAARPVSEDEVRRVHESAVLIDAHNDVTSETVRGLDIGARLKSGHTDVARLRAGGVDAVFFSAYVAALYARQGKAAERAREMIGTIKIDIIDRYPNDFMLALTAAEHRSRQPAREDSRSHRDRRRARY
jgi:membrane dipeptidase